MIKNEILTRGGGLHYDAIRVCSYFKGPFLRLAAAPKGPLFRPYQLPRVPFQAISAPKGPIFRQQQLPRVPF